jgi:hypothetical protein
VLSGAVVMRLKKIGVVATNDQLVVASADTLNYDGTLTVTNTGSPLAAGDKFYLFSAAAYSGAFTLTNLPALAAGLGWVTTNLAVDGSIMVTGPVVIVSRPIFTSVVLNNGQLILRGTNGTASMSYRVFGSTNLMQPLANWTPIVTNSFDGSGGFIFTNAVNPAKPAQFYDISVP